jgi:hypothetical protein
MSKCYLEDSIRTQTHNGPFERCAVCGKMICLGCVGRRQFSGDVWCIRCLSVSLEGDRLAHFTYGPRSLVYTTSQRRRNPRPIRHRMRRLFRGLGAPFRRSERQFANLNDYRFDLSFTTLNDKVQFGALLVLVVIAIVLGSVVYAELNGIPFRRVILAIALTCAFWAIVSIYLRFWFDNSSLGRTASQIISYIIATFLAFLMATWFINWSWLDPILGGK